MLHFLKGDSMAKIKRIGIIASGGDAQGMNACMKTIVAMADRKGMEVVAFLGGYQGLLDNDTKILTLKDVERSFNLGGSIILSGRSKDFMDIEKRKKAKVVYDKHKLEGIIVLGGDGSIRGAKDLEDLGLNVVVIPCTIDNDVFCSERSIGFDTAVNNAVDAIDNIQQTMSANGRVLIIEVMGRYCGDIALYSGLCSESDIIMIPEKQQTVGKIIREVQKQLDAGNISPTVIIAEHQFDVQEVAKQMENIFQKECRAVVLGYIQRGGAPTVQDRLLAVRMAVQSMECALNNEFGVVVSLQKDEIKLVNFEKAIKSKRKFREDIWNTFIDLKRYATVKQI